MPDYRIRFEKTGRAVYISHLDLMRTMQRAFIRAGIKVEHTKGFNPHPIMSFALPLSVGAASVCELMDYRGDAPEGAVDKLNAALPEGVRICELYIPETKMRDIKWVKVEGRFEYDAGAPAVQRLTDALDKPEIFVLRRTKRGMEETDIKPMIHSAEFEFMPDGAVRLTAVIAAQEPSLNPVLIPQALERADAALKPDFAKFTRLEVFSQNMAVFR